jgi:Ca2+-transporting ATPase
VSGSPTEVACLGWGLKLGMDFKQTRHASTIRHVETFNSTKKRAGVVYENDKGIVEAHWKGAAEIILGLCTRFVNEHGEVQVLTADKNSELKNVIEGMAAKSLRCIAFAYRPLEANEEIPTNEDDSSNWNQPDDNLILLGICGIKDPCRPGVREAVERCQRAGVKVDYWCIYCCHYSFDTRDFECRVCSETFFCLRGSSLGAYGYGRQQIYSESNRPRMWYSA